ncbi:ABC-2 family transporter protein [Patescibacteria group bacterium]|nr:ABC-2 family transporter protein [Patescibacteria group bacterium]
MFNFRFKTYWQLFWKFRKIHLMRALEYRGDFYFWTFISTIWTLFNLFFFDLLTQTGSIGGWNRHEILVLIGVFTIIDAFTWSIFYHNMKDYTSAVFSGELNQYLVKPINIQFLLMTHSNSFNNLPRLIIGAVVIIKSLSALNYQPSLLQILAFLGLLALACLFIYFIWFILATLSFWFERLDNINEIIPSLRRIWQVPRSVYTGVTSLLLTVIFPIGLATSIPTEVLLGKISTSWTAYFVVITLISFIFSQIFFKISIRKYAGAGN